MHYRYPERVIIVAYREKCQADGRLFRKTKGPCFSRGSTRGRWSIIRLCRAYRAQHACPACGECGRTSQRSVIDKVLMMLRLRTGNAELSSVFSLTLDLHLVPMNPRCVARADARPGWHAATTESKHFGVRAYRTILHSWRISRHISRTSNFTVQFLSGVQVPTI